MLSALCWSAPFLSIDDGADEIDGTNDGGDEIDGADEIDGTDDGADLSVPLPFPYFVGADVGGIVIFSDMLKSHTWLKVPIL